MLEAAVAVLVEAAWRLHDAVQSQKGAYKQFSHVLRLLPAVALYKRLGFRVQDSYRISYYRD